jgi:hypothetical protein
VVVVHRADRLHLLQHLPARAVGDARLGTRQYGARFLEALPEGIPVLGSSDELRAWVRGMAAG